MHVNHTPCLEVGGMRGAYKLYSAMLVYNAPLGFGRG